MLPRVAAEGLARYCDVFCESHVFTVDESRRVLARAKELGLGVRLHAEQLSLSGGAVLRQSLRCDCRSLEWIDAEGIIALSRAGVIAVLLPGAVFHLGLTRYAPARAMIEAELPVALATDFQSGEFADPVDADDSVDSLRTNANDSGGSDQRRDYQRSLQPGRRQPNWFSRSW